MGNSFSSIEDLMPSDQKDGVNVDDKKPTEALEDKISEISLKQKEEETAAMALQIGVQYMDLHGFPILTDAIKLIPKSQAEQQKVVCFLRTSDQIRLGFADANTKDAVMQIANDLHVKHNANVVVYFVSESSFKTALKFYDLLPTKIEAKGGVEITQSDIEKYQKEITDFKDLENKIKGVSLSDVIVIILATAIKTNASDVHIEAGEKSVTVRFRIDGVLHDIAEVASAEWDKLVSRLKLVAHLKLNITNKPQDGRFTIFLTDDKIEVRVSTIPTSYGESVVMRLLRSSAVGLQFDDLGVQGRAYTELMTQIQRPNGMIITTGPTGSGKTTTLYAILNLLNTPETKIITLEDPVEYKLEGINQSQIDAGRDYTFAKGLRSILRQDPDVVMVGEIRDNETADISVNAALTGHLVISTIHTNSAAGAIPRFLAMNTKPFLLAPALNAVIGQRLVRRICDKCKQESELEGDVLEKVQNILADLPENSEEKKKIDINNLHFYKGGGCDACHGLGYQGRIGIYEILIITPEIEKMILDEKVSEYDIEQKAKEQGMITMIQDGMLKALQGVTTVEEVFAKAE